MYFQTNQPENSFTVLPVNVIEKIFSYLRFVDVLKCRTLSPRLKEICKLYLSRNADILEKEIQQCMAILNNQITLDNNFKFKEKKKLLRAYNLLETLKQNIYLFYTLKRPHVASKDCWSLGQIFDKCRNFINSVKKNPFDVKNLHTISMWIQKYIANIVDKTEVTTYPLIGVRAVDYLDLMLQVHYDITINYNIQDNVCNLNGHYYLKTSKLLFYLPEIPFVKNCFEREITEEEQNALMKYLALLVNVHNRLIMKADQTRRDLELSRREIMNKKKDIRKEERYYQWPQYLWKSMKNVYHSSRNYTERKILDEHSGKIIETYVNCESCKHENFKEVMKCTVNLQCKLDEAPLQVLKSYYRLRNDIIKEHLLNVSNNCLKEDRNINDPMYNFDLILEINLPMKRPEIIELHFKHGKQIFTKTG